MVCLFTQHFLKDITMRQQVVFSVTELKARIHLSLVYLVIDMDTPSAVMACSFLCLSLGALLLGKNYSKENDFFSFNITSFSLSRQSLSWPFLSISL